MADLSQLRIPGIGPMRLARLEEHGLGTLEALAAIEAEELAVLPGFTLTVAERTVLAARALLDAPPTGAPVVVEVQPEADPDVDAELEPLRPRLRRGLEIARRIEDTRSWIRKARTKAKPSKRRSRFRQARLDLRDELKRLAKVLNKIQREAIRDGLSKGAESDLDGFLGNTDLRLERFCDRPLTVNRIAKLHDRMRRRRKELRARLT